MAWTREEAGHLLRRAGFGGSLPAVDRLVALGRDAAIAAVVEYESTTDTAWATDNPLGYADVDDWEGVRTNLMHHLATSARPLEARLTWYWHGHFTTTLSSTSGRLFRQQLRTWRTSAGGTFASFLRAVHKDGAMLQYLNGSYSHKDHPNENYSRESMELYSTGTGPYTEHDVREGARALTGWEVTWPDDVVQFNPDSFDDGQKTILGRTGNFNGDDFMSILAARPETARRVCGRLYRAFVSERINLVEVNRLVATWNANGGNLKSVLRALFRSTAFWDPRNRGTLVKDTLGFGFGLMQRLEIPFDRERLSACLWMFTQMGQAPFDVPNPAGYATGLRLAGASMLLARSQFAHAAVYDWAPASGIARLTAGLATPAAPATLVAQVVERMGAMPLSANTREAIAGYLGTTAIPAASLADRARDVAFFVACSPEYQVM